MTQETLGGAGVAELTGHSRAGRHGVPRTPPRREAEGEEIPRTSRGMTKEMPDLVGHDGKGQDEAPVIIKTIDKCKDQNLLHGFFAEALAVNELRFF